MVKIFVKCVRQIQTVPIQCKWAPSSAQFVHVHLAYSVFYIYSKSLQNKNNTSLVLSYTIALILLSPWKKHDGEKMKPDYCLTWSHNRRTLSQWAMTAITMLLLMMTMKMMGAIFSPFIPCRIFFIAFHSLNVHDTSRRSFILSMR